MDRGWQHAKKTGVKRREVVRTLFFSIIAFHQARGGGEYSQFERLGEVPYERIPNNQTVEDVETEALKGRGGEKEGGGSCLKLLRPELRQERQRHN